MKRAHILILLSVLTTAGCGVKGAPMPRRDEVFIEKTLIQPDIQKESPKKEELKKEKDKTTILPQKDPR